MTGLVGLFLGALSGMAALTTFPTSQASTQPAGRAARAAWVRQVRRLVADLDADEYATRELATQRLIEIGPDVISIINERMTANPSAELTERVRLIKSKWLYLSSDDPVAGGMQAKLTSPRESFVEGRAITLRLVLWNVSPRVLDTVEIRGIDLELPQAKAEFTSPRADGRLVIRRIGDDAVPRQGRPIVYDDADVHITFRGAGSNNATSVPLDAAIDLKAGDYDVQFIYYTSSKDLVPDAFEDLRSNTLRLVIKRP